MGRLVIGNRHVGTTDGRPDVHLAACFRTAKDRQRLGCDEMPKNGIDDPKRKSVMGSDDDDNVGPELLKLLSDNLEPADFSTAMQLLMKAGLSIDETDAPTAQGFAEDTAMFPHANRLGRPALGYCASSDRKPSGLKPESTVTREAREPQFPHWSRLK